MINWTTTREEIQTIDAIVKRAELMGLVKDRCIVFMDITACHANGTPLRLVDLLNAPNGDFIHDIIGIGARIDRETGKLTDCFLPRYAAHQDSWSTEAVEADEATA